MGYRLIISVSILSLLLTACFGAADGPDAAAGADAAAGQPVKEQPELSVPPLTDSGLSMLVEDNTCFPGLPGDLEPADDCYGFPVELVSDLKYRMNQEDADACIEYLDGLNQQDFRIANHEFLSLLDMTDEMTNEMAITDFNENEAEYSCYRCDTDGDGTDELIAFEKDGRGTISYVHMMVEGENGYVFFNSQYMDDVRFFTLFQAALMIPQEPSICRYTCLTGLSFIWPTLQTAYASTGPSVFPNHTFCTAMSSILIPILFRIISMMSYMTLSMQTGRKIHFMGMNGSIGTMSGLFCMMIRLIGRMRRMPML